MLIVIKIVKIRISAIGVFPCYIARIPFLTTSEIEKSIVMLNANRQDYFSHEVE